MTARLPNLDPSFGGWTLSLFPSTCPAMPEKILAIISAIGLVLPFAHIHAQQKRVILTGTLNQVISTSPFWTNLEAGDEFTLTVNYDTSYTTSTPTEEITEYHWLSQSMTAEFGDYVFTSPSHDIGVRVGVNYPEGFSFMGTSYFSAHGLEIHPGGGIQAGLLTWSDVVTSFSLLELEKGTPASTFNVINQFGIYNALFNGGRDFATASGVITGMRVETIPEPSTWLLVGIGAICLGCATFRRRWSCSGARERSGR